MSDVSLVLSQFVLEELSALRVTPLGEDPAKLVHASSELYLARLCPLLILL